MEEINKLILEGAEVEEYHRLQNKFQEMVNESLEHELSIKSNWRYMRYSLLVWVGVLLMMNLFGFEFFP